MVVKRFFRETAAVLVALVILVGLMMPAGQSPRMTEAYLRSGNTPYHDFGNWREDSGFKAVWKSAQAVRVFAENHTELTFDEFIHSSEYVTLREVFEEAGVPENVYNEFHDEAHYPQSYHQVLTSIDETVHQIRTRLLLRQKRRFST